MIFGDAEDWTWIHKPTEIQVWRDAIDLTSGKGGQVFSITPVNLPSETSPIPARRQLRFGHL